MKINVGCGRKVLSGWVNVDIIARDGVDVVCDARELPFPDCSVDVVMGIHVIEHFYQWEAPVVLAEWRRVLKRGGSLILELPNIRKACQNLLKGRSDQMSMWALYGNPDDHFPYNAHKWGYTPGTLDKLLAQVGFEMIEFKPPETHGRKLDRDMRVEAVRRG